MRLGRPMKLLVGLGTAAYVVTPFLFAGIALLTAFLGMFLSLSNASRADLAPETFAFIPLVLVGVVFPLQCVFIVLSLAMLAFYLIHVIKNNAAQETLRILLGLGFVFMPFLAMPVYYFTYIWPEQSPEWALAPRP